MNNPLQIQKRGFTILNRYRLNRYRQTAHDTKRGTTYETYLHRRQRRHDRPAHSRASGCAGGYRPRHPRGRQPKGSGGAARYAQRRLRHRLSLPAGRRGTRGRRDARESPRRRARYLDRAPHRSPVCLRLSGAERVPAPRRPGREAHRGARLSRQRLHRAGVPARGGGAYLKRHSSDVLLPDWLQRRRQEDDRRIRGRRAEPALCRPPAVRPYAEPQAPA